MDLLSTVASMLTRRDMGDRSCHLPLYFPRFLVEVGALRPSGCSSALGVSSFLCIQGRMLPLCLGSAFLCGCISEDLWLVWELLIYQVQCKAREGGKLS